MYPIARCLFICLISFGICSAFYWNEETQFVRGGQLNTWFGFVNSKTTTCDILFLGNSRVSVTINPKIIDSVTHLNSYCVGPDGTGILTEYMFLKKFLETHNSCKYVVVQLDYLSLVNHVLPYNYPDYYYFLNDTSVYNVYSPYSWQMRYYYLLKPFVCIWKLVPSTDDAKLTSVLNFLKGRKEMQLDKGIKYYKGFWGSPLRWDPNYKPEKPIALDFDESGFEIVDKIVDLCKSKNCKLLFVYPPVYKDFHKVTLNYAHVNLELQNYAQKKQIPYFNYTTMDICNSKEYFYNIQHLNHKGANIFSTELANDIRKFDSTNTNSNTP